MRGSAALAVWGAAVWDAAAWARGQDQHGAASLAAFGGWGDRLHCGVVACVFSVGGWGASRAADAGAMGCVFTFGDASVMAAAGVALSGGSHDTGLGELSDDGGGGLDMSFWDQCAAADRRFRRGWRPRYIAAERWEIARDARSRVPADWETWSMERLTEHWLAQRPRPLEVEIEAAKHRKRAGKGR